MMKWPNDPIHRLLAINGIVGAVLGLAFVAAVFWLDIGHIQRLVANDSGGPLAIILMAAGFVITCASLAMGSAIMLMPRDDDQDPPDGGLPEKMGMARELVPVRVRQTGVGRSR